MDDPDHRLRLAAAPVKNAPALFLDRDGTLIEDPGYLADPDRVVLLPGVVETLSAFRNAGYALVLVTNQSGIGRGLYAWSDYDAVAERLRRELAAGGVVLDAELACGHAPGAGAPSDWRKPAPGMLLEAAKVLDLDLSRSWMVGDKMADMEAGQAAGVARAVHVATGQGERERAAVLAWPATIPVICLDGLGDLQP